MSDSKQGSSHAYMLTSDFSHFYTKAAAAAVTEVLFQILRLSYKINPSSK